MNCPFRNYDRDTKVVESMISHNESFVDASLFENCYCFKYDVVCSKDDFNNLPDDVEGIMIGNECMQSETEIDFSIFENVTVIDVGYKSLESVTNLILEGMIIDVRLIDLIFLILIHSIQDSNHSIQQIV